RARRSSPEASWSSLPLGVLTQRRVVGCRRSPAADGRARPTQADLAVERLELDARAAGADHEVVAPARAGAVEPDGEVRVELARVSRDADGGVGGLGYGNGDVAVVCGEPVTAVLEDAARVRDVAVDGGGAHAPRIDAGEVDVALHVLDGDVAGGVAHGDVAGRGADLDAATGVLDADVSLHGPETHASRDVAHEDLAADGLDGDVGVRAQDGRIGGRAADVDGHPRRDVDAEIHGPAAGAMAVLRAHAEDGAGRANVDVGPGCDDAHLVPAPRADHDLALDVRHLEAGAAADGDGRVRRLEDAQGNGHGAEERGEHRLRSLHVAALASVTTLRSRSTLRWMLFTRCPLR